jgi:probable DNA repair protein
LLQISPEIFDFLNLGGTLIVPTRQRAAAVRLAHTGAQLRSGRRVWSSPEVLPWTAWLQRGLDQARASGVEVPRRLSAAEEWLLWREAVREACAALPVLWPDALIDDVRRGAELLEDYGLEPRVADTAETAVLLQACTHVRRRCRELAVLRSSSWRDCEPYLLATSPTRMAGFSALGPARRRWLERCGIPILLGNVAPEEPAAVLESVRSFEDPEREAEAAAQWCAAQLARDPQARLLLVVARLAEQRHRWVRALSQRLDYRSILEPEAVALDGAYAIEGGRPLNDYALIVCALRLIALYCGEADFPALSTVLRSPFIGDAGREWRLRIDVWLREQNFGAGERVALRSLLAPARSALGPEAGATLDALDAALAADETDEQPGSRATARLWAQRFAALLARCGWPGRAQGSSEQQVRMRFDELLGEFAALSLTPMPMESTEALELLQGLAGRIAFEPASDDVPVTLTAALEDPIVQYDGIWVAGLSAEAWPPAARPDPLVPVQLQHAAGVPTASPGGQLRLAENVLERWRRATPLLNLSWSRSDGDLRRDPSPLLPAIRAAAQDDARSDVRNAPPWELQSWLAAQAPPLESWSDVHGPRWSARRLLPGGTRLLERQSQCPFRGFAQFRLRAEPLPEPTPGIDARLRGQILHRALELFWRATGDFETLRARSVDATLAQTRAAVASALAEAEVHVAGSLAPTMLQREGERARLLLQHLIDWELGREPFQILHLEWQQRCAIDDATLRLRLDRVDQLADGRLLVIDYKSGPARSFDATAARPEQPQLLVYALAAGEETAAVLALYLAREGLKFRGIADRAGRVPGLRGAVENPSAWPGMLRDWRAQLQQLVREFLAGYAAVEPQPRACESCHLQAFCRVDPARLTHS